MIKRFMKDNRGQVLYVVIVTMMFLALLAVITMGLTLQNYHAAQQKKQYAEDYYAADAVAELIRIGEYSDATQQEWDADVSPAPTADENGRLDGTYTIVRGTVTLKVTIEGENFKGWEVSYRAKQQENAS